MEDDLAQDRAIARKLPRAWPAFFQSFGRLTPVQRASVPVVLDGRDTLVVSPTASGKTEAVCAPLIERYFQPDRPWMILYISPTRALVNDLYERLWQPLRRLSLTVGRRTGDHRDRPNASDVLLTTPESFDSMLCRGRIAGGDGHLLAHVVALVLDEIHLLHGTARGEQVRWLIERLRRLRAQAKNEGWSPNDGFQIIALSATIAQPEAVADAYLPNGQIVQVPGQRQISTATSSSPDSSVESALPSYLSSAVAPEKILVFSNSRRRVDYLAAHLRPVLAKLSYEVRGHHGSLATREREAAERALKTVDKIVVFSTSTLELGIDIGNIDLVVLDSPAPDMSAFFQRIGRGNRRTSTTDVMACAGSVLETVVQSAMIEAARDGWLGDGAFGPQHAVARQQVASYIFQSAQRSRSRAGVQSLLNTCAAPVVATSLIDRLVGEQELLEDGPGLRLGDTWMQKTSSGALHSTIEDMPGVDVVDEETGRAIVHGLSYQSGRGLAAGGLLLEARSWKDRKLEVRRVKEAGLARGEWAYTSRAWLKGPDQPKALRRYLDIEANVWPLIRVGSKCYVFHFGGSVRKAVIELAAAAAGIEEVKANEWCLVLDGQALKPDWIENTDGLDLEVALANRLDSLERTLGRPRANRSLPLVARIDEVRQWLRIGPELAELQSSQWEQDLDEDLRAVLTELAEELES